jgi:3-isopropylmalate dehydratase small subunit
MCLREGLIDIFKTSGALFGNAGCAGCASGQIGQNGPGEKTVSTGNRNFEGKQGKGEVYLASVETAAASAIAGHLTTADNIPVKPTLYALPVKKNTQRTITNPTNLKMNTLLKGKIWLIIRDNIDTDMIFHNRHLSITDIGEMGKHTFGNLAGWEEFSTKVSPGDIVISGKNFGCGSSRQQAVDCFRSLQIQAILALSFGAIYERNAINAGFPVLTYEDISSLDLVNGDEVILDLVNGNLTNLKNDRTAVIGKFSDIQMKIYKSGDLLTLTI